MTTDTMTKTTKGDTDAIRHASMRTIARRRGLKVMKRRDAFWIVRDDELIAGGARGLSIDEAERRLRELTKTMPKIAD